MCQERKLKLKILFAERARVGWDTYKTKKQKNLVRKQNVVQSIMHQSYSSHIMPYTKYSTIVLEVFEVIVY